MTTAGAARGRRSTRARQGAGVRETLRPTPHRAKRTPARRRSRRADPKRMLLLTLCRCRLCVALANAVESASMGLPRTAR